MILKIFYDQLLNSILIALFSLLLIILIIMIIKKDKKKDKKKDVKKEVIYKKINEDNEEMPSELESLLEKMQSTINNGEEKEVIDFEHEQEEKAIISYQELLKANNKKEEIIDTVIKDNKNQEQYYNDLTTPLTDRIENDNKKFKNTEFISPIYGKQEKQYKYPTIPSFTKEELEEDYYEPQLIEEVPKEEKQIYRTRSIKNNNNDEFLNYLKEFRKNLD